MIAHMLLVYSFTQYIYAFIISNILIWWAFISEKGESEITILMRFQFVSFGFFCLRFTSKYYFLQILEIALFT